MKNEKEDYDIDWKQINPIVWILKLFKMQFQQSYKIYEYQF